MVEGYSVKHSQEPFEIQYFMFYNTKEEKDFKINLNVVQGLADIYVSTFKEESEDDEIKVDYTK